MGPGLYLGWAACHGCGKKIRMYGRTLDSRCQECREALVERTGHSEALVVAAPERVQDTSREKLQNP